jgi:hypothetical protein
MTARRVMGLFARNSTNRDETFENARLTRNVFEAAIKFEGKTLEFLPQEADRMFGYSLQ